MAMTALDSRAYTATATCTGLRVKHRPSEGITCVVWDGPKETTLADLLRAVQLHEEHCEVRRD